MPTSPSQRFPSRAATPAVSAAPATPSHIATPAVPATPSHIATLAVPATPRRAAVQSRGRLLPRAWGVAVLAGLALAPTAAAAAAEPDAAALSLTASDSWARAMTPAGVFPNPVPAEVAQGYRGFAPPMLSYGLHRTGQRHERPDLESAAEHAWPNAVAPERASSFDMLGAAYAYRRLRLSDARRAQLADYLSRYTVPANWASCLLDPVCYSNLKLADATAVLAMTGSGVVSPHPGTRLADPALSREAAAQVINRHVPEITDHGLRARVGNGRAFRGSLLSDPPRNPIAYHALSTFMLAEAVQELGPDATPRAHRALRETLDALSVLVAPDGDVSYLGRGQGQVWVPALTAGAMATGARLAAGGDPRRAARYRAVARVALARIGRLHQAPIGLRVVPGDRSTFEGLDYYVNTVAYNGLALFGLQVAADAAAATPALSPERPPARGKVRVDDERASGLGVVGDGRVWLAVNTRPRYKRDLRYDFGLAGLQLRTGARGWASLLAPRPLTTFGQGRSAGPVLIRSGGRPALPTASDVKVRGDVVEVRGGFRHDRGLVRGGMRFDYTPLRRGVRVTLRGVRRGDRYRLTAFTPLGSGRPGRRRLETAHAVWRFDRRVRMTRQEPVYHSAQVQDLEAFDIAVAAPPKPEPKRPKRGEKPEPRPSLDAAPIRFTITQK